MLPGPLDVRAGGEPRQLTAAPIETYRGPAPDAPKPLRPDCFAHGLTVVMGNPLALVVCGVGRRESKRLKARVCHGVGCAASWSPGSMAATRR